MNRNLMKQNITNAELELIRLGANDTIATSNNIGRHDEEGGLQFAPGRRGAYDDYDNEEEEW